MTVAAIIRRSTGGSGSNRQRPLQLMYHEILLKWAREALVRRAGGRQGRIH
jgi:hypothetical protein